MVMGRSGARAERDAIGWGRNLAEMTCWCAVFFLKEVVCVRHLVGGCHSIGRDMSFCASLFPTRSAGM